jgi:protein-tyrosine phosphatase
MHCTAGKDRTGVAAAIVLRALGVSTQAVIEDYVLSASLQDLQQLYGGRNFQRHGSWEFLSTLPPEIRAPLIAAEPEYIEAMLGTLDQRYGSVDGYLASRLGVTDAALGHIRELYLDR